MTDPVAPSRTDPAARAWTERIGGPVGDRALPHRWWTPVRVILAVATIVCGLALVQKVPCIETGWNDNDARYAKMCYSDVPYLYTLRGFSEQIWPYSDTNGRYQVIEYPPVISYYAYGTALITALVADGPPESLRASSEPGELFGLPGMIGEVTWFYLINAVLLLAIALLSTYWMVGAHPRRPWDALMFAASPVLLFNALINWDLLAVACVAGAFWAWARGRPILTGVFLGLGTATKLYPLFLFGAMLVVCIRRKQVGAFAQAAAAGAVVWVLANLPAMLTGLREWKVFWQFNSDRGPDLGSLWYVAALRGHPASADTINLWSWVIFAAICAGVLVLGLVASHPPRMAQLGFLIVCGFLLVNKVYSPQYVLWLLPLAVLARPRWRDVLLWQAGELFYFGSVWLFLGGYTASGTTDAPDPVYQVAIVVRVVAELVFCGLVIRDVLEPHKDPVRARDPDLRLEPLGEPAIAR